MRKHRWDKDIQAYLYAIKIVNLAFLLQWFRRKRISCSKFWRERYFIFSYLSGNVFGYYNIYLLYNDKWLTSVDNASFSNAKRDTVSLFWAITTLGSHTHRSSFHADWSVERTGFCINLYWFTKYLCDKTFIISQWAEQWKEMVKTVSK